MNNKNTHSIIIGGQHLSSVKKQLLQSIKVGVTPIEIDTLADSLILKLGDKSSFKSVANYYYTTCVNINSGMVHGIPDRTPFKPKDLVTIDLGLIHKERHFDTSFTVQIPPKNNKVTHFLEIGKQALSSAISKALPGNNIYQISKAMQKVIESANFSVTTQLTGHGIGKKLHEEPSIPCFADPINKKDVLKPGQTIAIEAMYAMGDSYLKLGPDGWTMSTADGSLTAVFEETVLITDRANIIITSTDTP